MSNVIQLNQQIATFEASMKKLKATNYSEAMKQLDELLRQRALTNGFLKFRFNTGRLYGRKGTEFAGQVIDVESVMSTRVSTITGQCDQLLVKFWDRSRNLEYGFAHNLFRGQIVTQAWLQEQLMYLYDHNLCVCLGQFERRLATGEI